jgi:hypothetical protein
VVARAFGVHAAGGGAGFAVPAQADVIVVAPDGAVSVRARAGVVRWHGGAEETEPPAEADLSDIPLPDSAVSPFRASSASSTVPAPPMTAPTRRLMRIVDRER